MILPAKAAGWAPSVQRGHPLLPVIPRGHTARPSLGGAPPPGRGATPAPQSRRQAGGRLSRGEGAGRSPYLLLVQRATRPGGSRSPRQWRTLLPNAAGSSMSTASSGAPFSRSFCLCQAVIPL
ncbi:hypothetical protein NDU88_004414 [Pleurodeles waltl]|uniref:Uncharacterized protein n=1 Tax=Pleurodeles waltl TaxID=8319 RepID=A0AAV7UF78_PLEWA|nr:hypothetical protein NDU88_004414 [Pleurodeles waltl]